MQHWSHFGFSLAILGAFVGSRDLDPWTSLVVQWLRICLLKKKKNPPSNAEDAGSIPGWGTKIPCATGQLSPCVLQLESLRTTTTESAHSGTCMPQLEKPTCHNKDPAQPKKKEIITHSIKHFHMCLSQNLFYFV